MSNASGVLQRRAVYKSQQKLCNFLIFFFLSHFNIWPAALCMCACLFLIFCAISMGKAFQSWAFVKKKLNKAPGGKERQTGAKSQA